MIDNQQKNKLLRMARFIAALYLVSTGVFAVIVFALPQRLDQPQLVEPSMVNTLILVFGLMAFAGIVMGFVLPDRILLRLGSETTLSQRSVASTVLRCALFETPAIYGVALSFIGASMPVALGFIIVSAGCMLITFPTEEKIVHFLNAISR